MADPISLIALGAAVGGAAGKFVEKAWDSGERWITAYFKDHHIDAVAAAKVNSAGFLNELAARIAKLESSGRVSVEDIGAIQKEPDFAALLQRAILGASQTSSLDKHQLLARLVTERLQSSSETTLALATRMASEAVPLLTNTQLSVLAVSVVVRHIEHEGTGDLRWLEAFLLPFNQLDYTPVDLAHLEASSCIRFSFLATELRPLVLAKLKMTDKAISENLANQFLNSPTGQHLQKLWKRPGSSLSNIGLTSVGQLIGVCVSDRFSESPTSFANWK